MPPKEQQGRLLACPSIGKGGVRHRESSTSARREINPPRSLSPSGIQVAKAARLKRRVWRVVPYVEEGRRCSPMLLEGGSCMGVLGLCAKKESA